MGTRLYVGNLPYTTNDQDLRTLFGEAGLSPKDVRIITDRMTGQSRGFAFVEVEDGDAAQAAITALNGKDYGGRTLTVNEARERTAGGPGGPGGPPGAGGPPRRNGFGGAPRPGGGPGGGFGGPRSGPGGDRGTRPPREFAGGARPGGGFGGGFGANKNSADRNRDKDRERKGERFERRKAKRRRDQFGDDDY